MNLKPLLALGLLTGACIKQDQTPDELRTSIPTADQVGIKLPGSADKTLGQLANWYVSTRGVTRTFNGGSAWVLVTVHTIIEFPVTTVNGNTYTWGPWSGDALDPANYKLDVTAIGDGTYSYQLQGQSKTVAGAQFETIISGTSDPRAGEDKGTGEFFIDFDAARHVNPVDNADSKGTVDAKYDLATKHLELNIASTDDAGSPINAEYQYDAQADGGGAMLFDVLGDAGRRPGVRGVDAALALARQRLRPRRRSRHRRRSRRDDRDRERVLGHDVPAHLLHRQRLVRADRRRRLRLRVRDRGPPAG